MDDLAGQPLAGIRVLDLSRLLPGPYCSLLLADMGAEVIKVETPLAGDYARMAPAELGFGGVFEAVNRGKRSIAVDYRRPRGRDLLLRLARTADVFLESSLPGQMSRRGLGTSDVRAVNPRIIYCSLSGFGQTGPYRDRPGHDVDYLALGGLLSILGPIGARPVPPGVQLADIAGGTLAALRIIAALVARERTGQGAYLDVAVLDAVAGYLGTLGSAIESAGRAAGPMAGAYPCYGVYDAADGRSLAVGALELPFWTAFCRGIERDDLVPRQFDPAAIEDVRRIIARRTTSEWLQRFEDDACVALVNLPCEARLDPQLQARDLVVGSGGSARIVTALRATRRGTSVPPAPVLGADTTAVLDAAGIAPRELRRLEAQGIVAGRQTPERAARAARLGSVLARMAERRAAKGTPVLQTRPTHAGRSSVARPCRHAASRASNPQ